MLSVAGDALKGDEKALKLNEEALKSEEKVLKGDGMCEASLEMH